MRGLTSCIKTNKPQLKSIKHKTETYFSLFLVTFFLFQFALITIKVHEKMLKQKIRT